MPKPLNRRLEHPDRQPTDATMLKRTIGLGVIAIVLTFKALVSYVADPFHSQHAIA
jgi:hypothetical protein